MLRRIGAEEGGEFKAVASGTLPSGRPVVVNADGTVSSVSITSGSFGTEVAYDGSSDYNKVTFIGSNKVVVVYQDNGNSGQGTAIVGTISGTSISFGSATVFNSNSTLYTDVEDVGNNKVLIAYHEASSTDGRARVGTVSGTSISFGTEVAFETSGDTLFTSISKVSDDKAIVGFVSDVGSAKNAKCRIASISGTSVSFGTAVTLSTSAENTSVSFIGSDKFLVAFRHPSSSDRGEAIVGTISGTSISFGSIANYTSSGVNGVQSVSVGNSKVVIAYYTTSNAYGTSIVATISGTSVSFGTAVVFESASVATQDPIAIISPASNTVEIAYSDVGDSRKGTVISGTVSDTSISFGSSTVFASADTRFLGNTDLGDYKSVIVFRDGGNSNAGTAIVQQIEATNITSENYIGMSRGVAFQTGSASVVGSATVYNAGAVEDTGAAFDSNSNKIVIAFKDAGDSNKGKAIVGTVSGSSISFGSEVTFNNGSTDGSSENISVVFDSTNNKVIIAYRDVAAGTPFPLKCIVGTVSGTSISFGSAATVKNCNPTGMSLAYDSSAGKVVVAFGDLTNSGYGTAAVGTVSGTSISFGSLVVFANNETYYASLAYDSNAQKIVAVYQNSTGSGHGTAIVGTVSGTSISFGSAVVYNSAETNVQAIVYDASAQKVVIAYRNNGNSSYGTGIVGTVSGTSISFGSAVVFESSAINDVVVVYDANAQKPVVLYQNEGTGSYEGTAILGTISGTSISFGSSTEFESDTTSHIASAYDSNAQKLVISYRDGGNSNYGTARVFQPDTRATTRAEVAGGGNASMDIIGSVSENQIGLTAGQQYFVQNDGTIGTTAATPSVLAGTAISATELVVKT